MGAREGSTHSTDSEELPIEELITLYGTVAGQQVTILKDDGCNTNVMAKSFVDKNLRLLNIRKTQVKVNHSDKDVSEDANEIVIDAELEIGKMKYRSNWIVANCRYEILLGIPWHIKCKPTMDYGSGCLKLGDIELPTSWESSRSVPVHNIGVKKFRSLLRKKKLHRDDTMIFQLRSINNFNLSQTKD